jgi:hypothetical protein
MNQIFGHQIFPEESSPKSVVFDEAQPLEVPRYFTDPCQVRLFADLRSYVQTYFSQQGGLCSYVWGIPVHPAIAQPDIPKWCAEVVATKRYGLFRALLGTFVVIVDEPRHQRITFITDALGIRPMFFGRQKGRLVFGSEVWPMQKAGLIGKVCDYDAISAWIAYGYNCTEGSLFADLRRLPPGSALIFQNDQCIEVPYAEFQSRTQQFSIEQAAEELHNIVSSTVKVLLKNHPQVSIALSGGYDSRYLLSLALSVLPRASVKCVTVGFSEEEMYIAHKVAETLKISFTSFPFKPSAWDLYDQVYHFTPDGFPISKFVTYCIAQQYPGLPMLNVFMGDSLIRGSHDQFHGKYETEWDGDLADVLQNKHLLTSFDIFRTDIADCVRARSRQPMEAAVRRGSRIGRIFGWADFYYRQRHYISNNFLQHRGLTEALLPFYSWALLAYKMEHGYGTFNHDVYKKIFHSYIPSLTDIPHAAEILKKRRRPAKVARCMQRWARELLPAIWGKGWLSLLSKNRCLLLSLAGIAGVQRVESSIFALERLYLLEKRARDEDIAFDWESLR